MYVVILLTVIVGTEVSRTTTDLVIVAAAFPFESLMSYESSYVPKVEMSTVPVITTELEMSPL